MKQIQKKILALNQMTKQSGPGYDHSFCGHVVNALNIKEIPFTTKPGNGKNILVISSIKCPRCDQPMQVRDFGMLTGIGHKKRK